MNLARNTITFSLLAIIVAILVMIFVAVSRYTALFAQPGARLFVLEPVGVLVAYAVAIVWVGRMRGPDWDTILRSAALYGLLGGGLEILNIGIENGIPVAIHAPAVPIGFMLAIFSSWGVAGFRSARALQSIRGGLLTAVASAGVCMLIAVAAGTAIQFFLAVPSPEYVATWAEFKRSGWSDARAFGLANTLESAFTHLVVAPIVALVVGGAASLLAQRRTFKGGAIRSAAGQS